MMSLHYLVKLEMLICTCYHWVVTESNSRIDPISPICCFRIRQIWVHLITSCGKYCKRSYTSLIWSYRRRHWQMAATVTIWSSLVHSVLRRFFQFITITKLMDVIFSRIVWEVLDIKVFVQQTCCTCYTLWSIKAGHYMISDNFVKCEPISATFALLWRKLNFQQNPCNIYHFTLTLVSHYLGKFERIICLKNQGMWAFIIP